MSRFNSLTRICGQDNTLLRVIWDYVSLIFNVGEMKLIFGSWGFVNGSPVDDENIYHSIKQNNIFGIIWNK